MTDTMARSTRRATRAVHKASFTCAAALAAAAGIGALGGASARANHIEYKITQLGYFGGVHVDANNVAYNSFAVPQPMNPSGAVVGHTLRFENDPNNQGAKLSSGQTAWVWIPGSGQTRVGLFSDSTYVQPTTNNQFSAIQFLNNASVVGGNSTRYKNATEEDGVAVWIQRPGETALRIGLVDSDHIQGTYQSSTLVDLNNTALGQAVGTSLRYTGQNGVNDGGQSAWYFDGTTTEQIGLFGDGEHGTTAFQSNNVVALNDNGVSVGTAIRFEPDLTEIGTSAWMNTESGAQKMGFFSGSDNSGTNSIDYTQDDDTRDNLGRRESTVVALSANNAAVGTSNRYRGQTFAGLSAWIHTDTTGTTQIGLTGSDHTKNDLAASDHQYQTSSITKLTETGKVLGISERFGNTASSKGQSAWVYDGTDTNEVGLGVLSDDDEHRTNEDDHRRFSLGTHINPLGDAAGTSHRYNQTTNLQNGQSAWVYKSATTETIRAGLGFTPETAAEFTNSESNEQFSTVVALSDVSAQAVGHSRRYVDSDIKGQGAWFFDPATEESTRIGLVDPASFTRVSQVAAQNDIQTSTVEFLNDLGQAVGTSARYNGTATQQGLSAWFYDSVIDQTIELTIDGSANNADLRWEVEFLSDSGDVLGTYRDFGAPLSEARAFLWDYGVVDNPGTAIDERFHDLGDIIQGELAPNGWASLHSALEMSDSGHIRGFGRLTNTTYDMPYVLTPVLIPEPAGVALLAMSGLALLPRRRRR